MYQPKKAGPPDTQKVIPEAKGGEVQVGVPPEEKKIFNNFYRKYIFTVKCYCSPRNNFSE